MWKTFTSTRFFSPQTQQQLTYCQAWCPLLRPWHFSLFHFYSFVTSFLVFILLVHISYLFLVSSLLVCLLSLSSDYLPRPNVPYLCLSLLCVYSHVSRCSVPVCHVHCILLTSLFLLCFLVCVFFDCCLPPAPLKTYLPLRDLCLTFTTTLPRAFLPLPDWKSKAFSHITLLPSPDLESAASSAPSVLTHTYSIFSDIFFT